VYTENYGNFEDPKEVEIYQRTLLRRIRLTQHALVREFETQALGTEVHAIVVTWWYRIVPYAAYVKGWKISTSHFVNQDLATIWLDK